MASTADSLQPYLLSNFDFVTESLTLMAGMGSFLFLSLSYSLKTPVVVSSDRPFIPETSSGNLSKTMLVKSPPSSRIMFRGFLSSPKKRVCSMHQLNSFSFIPFHA